MYFGIDVTVGVGVGPVGLCGGEGVAVPAYSWTPGVFSRSCCARAFGMEMVGGSWQRVGGQLRP